VENLFTDRASPVDEATRKYFSAVGALEESRDDGCARAFVARFA